MLFTKSVEYAVQAMIYLVEKDSPEPTMVSEIAQAYEIPQHFLAKIVQTLVKFQFLNAVRGRKGGVVLAKHPEEIFVNQIVEAIEGPKATEERCVIGLDYCSDEQPCPFHSQWMEIREKIDAMLEGENLVDLAYRVMEKRKAMRQKGFPSLVGAPPAR